MAPEMVHIPIPFPKATNTSQLDSHTYHVNLAGSYCVAGVPNGGYVACCMLNAARAHLVSRGQMDALTAHFEYPGRASPGPAIVTIEDVKLGTQISTLQITLWQGDGLLNHSPWVTPSASRRVVIGYTNIADLNSFDGGMSVPTGYQGTPAAEMPKPHPPDFAALEQNGVADGWEETRVPKAAEAMMRSLQNWRFFVPRGDHALTPGVLDLWAKPTASFGNDGRIPAAALPYLVDSFPFNLHLYLVAPELRALIEQPPPRSDDEAGKAKRRDLEEKNESRSRTWAPTVVMNLEQKIKIPDGGLDWLNMRITSRQIKDGRFDLDIVVRDIEGEMVALSQHVALLMDLARSKGNKKPAL